MSPRGKIAIAAAVASVAVMMLAASSASAALLRPFIDNFQVRMGNPFPTNLTVDADGDVYVLQPNTGSLEKYDADGDPVPFTGAAPYIDENTLTGTPDGGLSLWEFGADSFADVAVDLSGGPTDGLLYVNDVNQSQSVDVFDSKSGTFMGYVRQAKANPEHEGAACGVDVDQSSGDLYVAFTDGWGEAGRVDHYEIPEGNPGKAVFVSQLRNIEPPPCAMAVDDEGNVYAAGGGDAEEEEPWYVAKYPPSEFGKAIPTATKLPLSVDGVAAIDVDGESGAFVVLEGASGVFPPPMNAQISEYDASGTFVGSYGDANLVKSMGIAYGEESVYASSAEGYGLPRNDVSIFGAQALFPDALTSPVAGDELLRTTATLRGEAGPAGGAPITNCHFKWGFDDTYGNVAPCVESLPITAEDSPVSAAIAGLVPGTAYHFRLFVTSANGTNFGRDYTFTAPYVGGVSTKPPSDVTKTTATLNGTLDPQGLETSYYFEYGATRKYGVKAPVPAVAAGSSPGLQSVSVAIDKLTTGLEYHYRLVAENAEGTTYGEDQALIPSVAPDAEDYVNEVNTDGAVLHALVEPNGLPTVYQFEYGLDTGYGLTAPAAPTSVGAKTGLIDVPIAIKGLAPDTTYHYRVTVENEHGSETSEDKTFTTFPLPAGGEDLCDNALSRQQTSAALLPDCRAYELVSVADARGHDVESDLTSEGAPYGGYPLASDPPRVLYALRSGAIPGVGNPPNYGPDPYLATRGENGWTTGYVGIPADFAGTSGPFSSVLGGADSRLDTFAFAGAGLCSPCFPDGGQGIPLRTPSGEIVQGMSGSLDPGPAELDGYVARYLSADGSTVVFGSTGAYEAGANDETGDVSIYARDLTTGLTRVVSKNPAGGNLPCLQGAGTCSAPGNGDGIAALDISSDGSRVVVAQRVATDSRGNRHWRPYLSIDGSDQTLDLAPGTTSGVIYAGMTADGSRVFFTSRDQLTGDDHDGSADLFEASIDGSSVELRRVSAGVGAGDTDACDPVANSDGERWNEVGGAATCSAVAIAGGGGVAAGDGASYFLSPEALDGEGVADEPNLYVARPGEAPSFVAALEPDAPVVRHALSASALAHPGDFQLTANGDFAAFVSRLSLTGFDNGGHIEVYRFAVGSGELECASCSPTGARTIADTSMARRGLSVTEDGRVFFTATDPLALRDTNRRKDVYQWTEGRIDLISGGTGTDDSGLLSVSADGVDAYFFTRDHLAPEDEGSQALKVYDARSEGGFFQTVPRKPCAASDECHGPGTEAVTPPVATTVVGAGPAKVRKAKPKKCPKGKVRKGGRCVKKAKKRRSKAKRHARKGKNKKAAKRKAKARRGRGR